MEVKKMSGAVLYGVGTILGVVIIVSAVFATILRFTSLDENSISLFITILSFLTLFIGGFITGGKAKEKGWLFGALTGGLFTLAVFMFQYLGYDKLFSMDQIIYHSCFTVTAMMGGILGVNVSGGKQE
ncbi:TIGR04086 family membrane protein [Bacillus sp. 2205SS5-2]|uniref:TIGR04086 family membrane protein n=1 Tax=Bacillus sp. 2205SS5-2 TaxID=3109031 RepID=UPI003006BF2F